MEKRERLHQALDEACEHGLGEFNIRIKEDGEFFVLDYRYKKNPSEFECTEAIKNISTFGGVETADGEIVLLKRVKKIKII